MMRVQCPRCASFVSVPDNAKSALCAACALDFGYVDLPKHTLESSVTSQVTQMATELSTEVDTLKAELARWQRALASLAVDMRGEGQLRAAMLVTGLSTGTAERLLHNLNLLRNGAHPLGVGKRRDVRGDEDDEEPWTP